MSRPLALALALALLLVPGAASASSGKVTLLEGTATRTTPGASAAAPLALDASVDDGDLVETAAGAHLEVTLADGSQVRLDESSRLSIDSTLKTETSWKVKLTLALGQVWARVTRKLGPDDGFEVHTERVVAGVRGTEFLVQAAAEEHQVEVYEGAVDVGVRGEGGAPAVHHKVLAGNLVRVDSAGRSAGPQPSKGERSFLKWSRSHERSSDRRDAARERRERLRERRWERREQRREALGR